MVVVYEFELNAKSTLAENRSGGDGASGTGIAVNRNIAGTVVGNDHIHFAIAIRSPRATS